AGNGAVCGRDRLLVRVRDADHDVASVAARAEREVGGGALAVALAVLAVVDVGFRAVEVLAGDEVDHARDGVGAVDRGRTVLQDLDPLDHGRGDGVQVDAAAQAGNPAAAVDQDEGAGGT